MKKIIECVPNFSEGRDISTIEAIAKSIRETAGCTLVDVDPGYSTNRTVYTFVGGPKSVVEGALAAAAVAKERIDMEGHSGEHPRFGAMDVCPFVPVAGVSMEECVEVSKTFAARASKELGIPLYLYEEAAEQDYRRKLPAIRDGEYEGLAERLKDGKWKPDFGPTDFVSSWGITATGARKFLIAYNVNILCSANQAHRIALNLREAGRGPDKPGKLKEVKGMGWYVDEYNLAQVTVNLNDYHVTSIHTLYEEVKKEAAALDLAVTGSEIVGVVPLEAMLMAADYYIEQENLFVYDEGQKIRLVAERLGLNSIDQFIPSEKIIEYIIAEEPDEPLASMTVREFIGEVSARSSAPGGGSASATIAAIGAGLGSMVAKLTWGVRRFEQVQPQMMDAIPILHEITSKLIPMIDADTSAFNDFLEGVRMPNKSKEEQAARTEKMQSGLKTAIQVPLSIMQLGDSAWDALQTVAQYGNPASKSDLQVAARALETGIWGAYKNVCVNMEDINDEQYKKSITKVSKRLVNRAKNKCEAILNIL